MVGLQNLAKKQTNKKLTLKKFSLLICNSNLTGGPVFYLATLIHGHPHIL